MKYGAEKEHHYQTEGQGEQGADDDGGGGGTAHASVVAGAEALGGDDR